MIAIIDYKAGNLTSVRLAFEALQISAEITSSAEKILAADHVVFPGVGAAGAAMQTLQDLGLAQVIRTVVQRKTPFLGICLGTQIIMEHSEEDGGVDGIGLIPGVVRRFIPDSPLTKIPQMGWNSVRMKSGHPVLNGIRDQSEFYFVHSYYPAPADPATTWGETQYSGITFSSMLGMNNLIATQFHPEKSGKIGLALLRNFAAWNGKL